MAKAPPVFNDVMVVGMHFRGQHAKDYAAALLPGDELLLEREPENQFDPNAIKCMAPGEEPWHMGYVEAQSAIWIANWLDEGNEYRAIVDRLEPKKNNMHPILTISLVESATA